MKNYLKICAAIAVSIGVASGTAMAAGWSNSVTISSIELDATTTGTSSTFLDFVSLPTGKPPACNNASQVTLVGSLDQVKAMTTLATSASLAGRQVRLYFDGTCTVLNGVSYANVQNLRMF